MATKSSIVAAIQSKCSSSYNIWRIGLTHDLDERKNQWKNEGENVTYWAWWQAGSLSDAQDIEAYFIGKGMKGGTGGNLSSWRTVYVYVF